MRLSGTFLEDVVPVVLEVRSTQSALPQFIIMGNGCHKIRDFNTLPGFENDTRQVFILLNETCEEETFEPTQAPSSPTDSDSPAPPTSTETPTSAAIEKSVSTALLRFAVTVIVVMFAV